MTLPFSHDSVGKPESRTFNQHKSHETLTCKRHHKMSMSYSIQNEDINSNSNISWNNQEPHQTQHLFMSNSSPNNHTHHNYNTNQHHNGIKDRKSYKSTHANYISYRNNTGNGNQYLSPNRYRRSSKYHNSRDRDQNNNNNNLSRLRNKTFRRQYLRDSDINRERDRDNDKYKESPSKSRYYDKDHRHRKSRRNMKDSDEDSSTFSFGADDSKQTLNNNVYNNNRKNNNNDIDEHKFNRNSHQNDHELDSDSNNTSSNNLSISRDSSENNDDRNKYNRPLSDSSLISDEEDTMNVNMRTVSISKSKSLMRVTSKRKNKGLKIRTGSKSCYEDDDDRDQQQHIFTPKANSVYTPKNGDDDNKFFEEEGNDNNRNRDNECFKCNSYKSELDHFKGIGINNLSMDRLMNLEKELLTSISRVQSAINEKYKNEKLCIVCQNNMKNCVFRPCGHFSTCHICSRQLGKCPICMSTIDDKFKIFQ